MGWSTWNPFGCAINEQLLMEIMDAMVLTGLRDHGYKYINIDDCWMSSVGRNATTQELIPDPMKFPRGISFLADYAHSKGLLLGIYSDIGFKTCQGYPASLGYYYLDAQTWANWGIDLVKIDYCYTTPDIEAEPWIYYTQMGDAIIKAGRPQVYMICNWGISQPWLWASQIANSWRTTNDINPGRRVLWSRVTEILDLNRYLNIYSKAGAFNDMDQLELGVNVTYENVPTYLLPPENRAHFAFWVLLNAPLILGVDIRNLNNPNMANILALITNEEVLAVSQDPLATQGKLLRDDYYCMNETSGCTRMERWGRPLTNGSYAIILFNRASLDINDSLYKPESISFSWQMLGLPFGKQYMFRDLFARTDLGPFVDQFNSPLISQHDVMLLKLTPYP